MTNALLISLSMLTAQPETPQAKSVRWALGMVESANDDKAVGKFCERSRFQILPSVWRQMDCSSARWKPTEANGWHVARRILIERVYFSFIDPGSMSVEQFKPEALYALWSTPDKFRLGRYRMSCLTHREQDRCRRFANLYRQRLAQLRP